MSVIGDFLEQYGHGASICERGVDFGGAPQYRGDSVILPSGRKMSHDAWRTEVSQGRKNVRDYWKAGEKARASAKVARYMRGKATQLQAQYDRGSEPVFEPSAKKPHPWSTKGIQSRAFNGFAKFQDKVIRGDEKVRGYIGRRAPEVKKALSDAARSAVVKSGVAIGKAYLKHKQNKVLKKELSDDARAKRSFQKSQKKARVNTAKERLLRGKNAAYANVRLFEGGADEWLPIDAFNQGRNAPGGGLYRGVAMAAKTAVSQHARNITRRNQANIAQAQGVQKVNKFASAAANKQRLASQTAQNNLNMAQTQHKFQINALRQNTAAATQMANMRNQQQHAQDAFMQAQNPNKFRKVQQGRDIKDAKQQAADAQHRQRVQGIASGQVKTGVAGFLDKFSAQNRHARAMEKGQRGLERDELNYNRAMYKNVTKMANPNYRMKMLRKAGQPQGGRGNYGIVQSFMQGYRGNP